MMGTLSGARVLVLRCGSCQGASTSERPGINAFALPGLFVVSTETSDTHHMMTQDEKKEQDQEKEEHICKRFTAFIRRE